MSDGPRGDPQPLGPEEVQRLVDQGATVMKVDEILAARAATRKNRLAPETVETWYHRGGFFDPQRGQDNIEHETFLRLLAKAKQARFLFWLRDDFEPDIPPEPHHHGLTICIKCGWVYWGSFQEEAMSHQAEADIGQICLPCLVSSWQSADSRGEQG